MTALTPLALNTWISAASAALPAKVITKVEMIAKPAASLPRPRPSPVIPINASGPGPRASGPHAGGTPALRKRALGSREAGDVGCLLGDEFEEDRGAFAGLGDAALDRRDDLAGIGDALAIAAQRLGEIGVMAADVGRTVFLGRDRHHLQLDRHREIVEEDREDRDALPDRGLEIHARKADRSIAPDIDAELVGPGELGAHRQAEAIAELGRLAPADVAERVLADPERRELVARAAGVMGDDRVLDVDGM